ncbi:MAG: hypothetical protein HC842_02620 [Cytophagales bacterium]|nr:hypothetical protein [Cytophagales bacterium]
MTRKNLLAIAALLVMASSCVTVKDTTLIQKAKKGGGEASGNDFGEYRVQKGDNLYIRVLSVDKKTNAFFQSEFPTLMNETYAFLNSYTVDDEGYINFSFVEKLEVKGLTLNDIKKQLQETINEYFKEATVTVKLANFPIAVLGEVSSPGDYDVKRNRINIFQALSQAGGIEEFGDRTRVQVIRQINQEPQTFFVDMTDTNILNSEFFISCPMMWYMYHPNEVATSAPTLFPTPSS